MGTAERGNLTILGEDSLALMMAKVTMPIQAWHGLIECKRTLQIGPPRQDAEKALAMVHAKLVNPSL